jgi:MFS family permease
MDSILQVLKNNRNYRYTWMGQVVSEIGDHFNNIAVFSLVPANTHSGLAVSGVMISRAVPAVLAGPIAGVLLDRLDRKKVMIASDLIRFVVALGFLLTVDTGPTESLWLLYSLSAVLMFASPFFTSGRAAILPTITTREELHTANSITQTTGWTTLTIGTFAAGAIVGKLGFKAAFMFNALSFAFSALSISRLRTESGSFRPAKKALTESDVARPWHEYVEGLRYMRASPLIFGIGLLGIGWASGGGAAQILFSLFGELVFNRGAEGIGYIWGCAGIGLIIGGAIGHRLGRTLSFDGYKRSVIICYVIHGVSYILFSQMQRFGAALFFIALSRAAIAVTSVMNFSQLLRHVSDEYRGRVFSTVESMVWSTMMISMMVAGITSQYYSPRTIGAWAGAISSLTAIFWAWAHYTGRLPEPRLEGIDPDEVEVHGEQTV